MYTVRIIAVGKLKESYFSDAEKEYLKRLGAYCRVEVAELKEAYLPDAPSEREIAASLAAEGKELLKKAAGSITAVLTPEGKGLRSEELAEFIGQAGKSGSSCISFIIGSSFGMSDEVKQKADIRISMSEMTFPHQLARVMLAEQLYRAFSILNNGKYHK